ncbi:helix-turn-helix transcriptional regulator [Actinomadura soli]|uniref:Helix-turn-helix transcriptional regulator n=1 Tax=Actinomadura soli TaxID=2508997 RepID=A0A5C4JHD1_9ACTN|nr:helix-turn-helix transcriptional regulator [Actinomadura soli]TMR06259.1 helix-turn-helix transcriptional regulator [Actinomadura soli]
MAEPEGLDPDRSLWDYIAIEVRRLRQVRGLSGNKLAEQLGCDRSYVSRVENGRLHLSRGYAERLDALWDTTFARLVRLAETSDDGDWFTGLTDHEARATRHRMWAALLVPGLLQTPEYTRALLSAGVDRNVEADLEARRARQAVVWERPEPPLVSVIFSWAVLAQPVGGSDVMRAQISHLLELAEAPHISIRVLEASNGAHNGLDGSFRLLTVGDREVAFTDAPERGRLVTTPTDVMKYAVRYDRLSDIAAPVGTSRTILNGSMETYQ